MKLIIKENLNKGQMLPNGWVTFGKCPQGKYLQINIPLFVLMWGIKPEVCLQRFGWHVPSIRFVWSYHVLVISWWYVFHSDFMGEELIIYDNEVM